MLNAAPGGGRRAEGTRGRCCCCWGQCHGTWLAWEIAPICRYLAPELSPDRVLGVEDPMLPFDCCGCGDLGSVVWLGAEPSPRRTEMHRQLSR